MNPLRRKGRLTNGRPANAKPNNDSLAGESGLYARTIRPLRAAAIGSGAPSQGFFVASRAVRTYAYGLLEGAANIGRLAVLPSKAPQARPQARYGLEVLQRDPFDAALAFHIRQLDASRDIRVADDALGLGALRQRRELVEKAP